MNLPKNLVEHSSRTIFHILTDARKKNEICPETSRVIADKIYRPSKSLHLSLSDKLRALRYLMSQQRKSAKELDARIFHFFFTPNPATSRILSLLLRKRRRMRLIHTVTSCPVLKEGERASSLFIDNAELVALSDHTRRILESALDRPVTRVYPGIPFSDMPTPTEIEAAQKAEGFEERLVYLLYPGDLHFAGTMPFWRSVLPALRTRFPQVRVVMVCRQKHPLDITYKNEIALMGGDNVIFRDNITELHRLFVAGDAVVFPVTSLYAKMDIPLALLEMMALGKPGIISPVDSLRELTDLGGVFAADPGQPGSFIEAIETMITSPLESQALGVEGAKIVQKHFNAAKMARAYEDMYHFLAEQSAEEWGIG